MRASLRRGQQGATRVSFHASLLARPSLAHAGREATRVCLGRAYEGDACIFVCTHRGAARVSCQRAHEVAAAGISWTRARKMHAPLGACKLGGVYLLGTRMLWIVLLHMKDVGVWGP